MFVQKIEEQNGVVVVALCGTGTEPSEVALYLEFFQTVFCQQKNHPFTVVRKRVILIYIAGSEIVGITALCPSGPTRHSPRADP